MIRHKLLFLLVITVLCSTQALALNSTHESMIRNSTSSIDSGIVDDLLDVLDRVDQDFFDDELYSFLDSSSERTIEDFVVVFDELTDDDKESLLDFFVDTDYHDAKELLSFFTDADFFDDDRPINNNDLSLLFGSLKSDLLNSTEEFCKNEIALENGSLAYPIQQAFQGALSNSIDGEFIDVQNWMQNTLLPSQREKDQLKQDAELCEREKITEVNACSQQIIKMNSSLEQCEENINNEGEQKNIFVWFSIFLLFVVCYTNWEEIQSYARNH